MKIQIISSCPFWQTSPSAGSRGIYAWQRPQQLARAFAELGHTVYYTRGGRFKEVRTVTTDLGVHVCSSVKDIIDLAIVGVCGPTKNIAGIKAKRIIYDSVDLGVGEFSSLAKVDKDYINFSDCVSATSQKIFEQKKSITDKPVLLVPNGCRIEDWSSVIPSRDKVVGYIGAVAPWVDWDLVGRTADILKDWTFIIVGENAWRTKVPVRRNIRYVGQKPYDKLKDYMSSFSVAMAPFKRTAMTEAVNPVKVYEYLASGLPVVCTEIPEYHRMNFPVRIANTPEEYAKEILLAYEDSDAQRLRAWAAGNTWKDRAKALLEA